MILPFVHIYFPVIFSLVAVAVIVFYSYVYRKYNVYPEYNNVLSVIQIVKNLGEICPINSLKNWKLLPLDYGSHRCWEHQITLPAVKHAMNLYGSSTLLSGSSANISSLIADVTKWAEWNPLYFSHYVVKSFNDKQLRRDHYMEAEQIISVTRETNKIQSHTSMYRFHDFTENKVGWILFWNAKKLEFMFFLIQPVKNKDDTPQCVVSHITGTQSKDVKSSTSTILQRLRNIEDMLSLSSISIMPLKFTSSMQYELEGCDKIQSWNCDSHENIFYLPAVRAHKREVRYTEFILVPFVPSNYMLKKNILGFKLAVKNMDNVKSEILSNNSDHNHDKAVTSKHSSSQKYPIRRAVSDFAIKSKGLSDLNSLSKSVGTTSDSNLMEVRSKAKITKQNLDSTSKESEAKVTSKSQLTVKESVASRQKLRSFSETAVTDIENNKLSSQFYVTQQDDQSSAKLHDINENVEENVLAMDKGHHNEMFNSSVSDFEIVDSSEFSENRVADFMTQGNYGASELQAEVLLASQLDINSDDCQLSGGWMFHSYYRGMSVLTKTTSSRFMKISSFLCQTEIPVAPKDIWKFVKTPQFRFICDENVKSVEVLERISNSQKLIHTYHEVSGFLKKELIDFCLLQTERKELNKYYSCFYSVEFDKCPFMNSVIRGTLRPSGWIIEEIENDAKKCKVTFMMQVLVSSSDSLFLNDLSTMVPQSVYNLKNYTTSKPM